MLNTVIMEGRLTKDPEMKRSARGLTIANFIVACDSPIKRDGKTKTTYLPCTFFGSQAENIIKYFSKGRAIIVVGHLDLETYEDKDTGKPKAVYSLVGERFEFPIGSLKSKDEADIAPEVEEAAIEGNNEEKTMRKSNDILDSVTDDLPF